MSDTESACERFRLLSLEIKDDELKKFYHELMIAEAGHYTLFIKLAKQYFDEEEVDKRWEEFLNFEAKVMQDLELRGDRVH